MVGFRPFRHFWFCMWKRWPKPKDRLHFTQTALDWRFCRCTLHDSHDGDAGRGTTAHPTCLQLHPHGWQCEEHTQGLSPSPPSCWQWLAQSLPVPYCPSQYTETGCARTYVIHTWPPSRGELNHSRTRFCPDPVLENPSISHTDFLGIWPHPEDLKLLLKGTYREQIHLCTNTYYPAEAQHHASYC